MFPFQHSDCIQSGRPPASLVPVLTLYSAVQTSADWKHPGARTDVVICCCSWHTIVYGVLKRMPLGKVCGGERKGFEDASQEVLKRMPLGKMCGEERKGFEVVSQEAARHD